MKNKILWRLLGFSALISIIGLVGFFYLWGGGSTQHASRQIVSHYAIPGSLLELSNFTIDVNRNGEECFSLQAGRLSIRKIKFGFFRFSLLNEILIKKAVLDFYGLKEYRGNMLAVKGPNNAKAGAGRLFLSGLFGAQGLFRLKYVSSIELKPVKIIFHGDKLVISQISASSARIRLSKGDMVFEGNVRVTAKGRYLQTQRLVMSPDNFKISTNRPFLLNIHKKIVRGRHLTTDIFLSPDSGGREPFTNM